jgi:glycerol-3-phosphate dehydrogenase
MLIPKTADGRVLFCIPWHGHVLIGTTDIPVERASLEPLAQENEVDFILEAASGYLAHQPARKDILSVFAGIRPLVRTAGNLRTSSLPRGHLIDIDTAGVLTITGGKWTTYRRMAEDAVDTAARSAGLPARPCVTEELRIRPSTGGVEGKPLHEDLPYRTSDVIAAVRAEMAQTLEDVLARRTRCLFLNASASIEAAPMTAAVIAAELNKDGQWIDAQVRSFKETASHYLAED